MFILLFAVVGGTFAACPAYDTDLGGSNIAPTEGIPNIHTWKDCAKECATSAACYGWTLITPSWPKDSHYHNRCYLQDQAAIESPSSEVGMISGSKYCGVCPMENTDLGGNNVAPTQGIPNIYSWNDCAVECQKSSACYSWTLIEPTWSGPDEYKNRCYLQDEAALNDVKDHQGMVSGGKGCGVCPWENTDLLGNNVAPTDGIPNIHTTESCSAQCAASSACYGWTLITPSWPKDAHYHNRCYLQDRAALGTNKVEMGMESGTKFCGEGGSKKKKDEVEGEKMEVKDAMKKLNDAVVKVADDIDEINREEFHPRDVKIVQ